MMELVPVLYTTRQVYDTQTFKSPFWWKLQNPWEVLNLPTSGLWMTLHSATEARFCNVSDSSRSFYTEDWQNLLFIFLSSLLQQQDSAV